MALQESQLSVVLQAGIDKGRELIEAEGGFLPFGARAKPSGEIEFVQIAAEGEDGDPGTLQRRLGEMLTEEARRGELLGSALVAHALTESGATAIVVLLETPGFSRAIVVPYRIEGGSVELHRMEPAEASPVVFARLD